MAIFNSYVKLPEGTMIFAPHWQLCEKLSQNCRCWKLQAFITAWFYHTKQASWTGLLVGLLFQLITFRWIRNLKPDHPEHEYHAMPNGNKAWTR